MRASLTLTILIGASLITSAAIAEKHHENGNDHVESEATPEIVNIETDKLVAGRRAGFWMSAATLGATMKQAEAGADARTLMFGAQVLNNWSKTMPGLFPKGAVNDKSNALPNVWEDREGFEAAAALYQSKTAELMDLAKAGDTETFTAQIKQLHKTCSACHDTYRKERTK